MDKCPKCGGVLHYNAITSTYDCDSCGYQVLNEENDVNYNINDNYITPLDNEKNNINVSLLDENFTSNDISLGGKLATYNCLDCNSNFAFSKELEECPFCFSKNINKKEYLENMELKNYLAFKISKEQAIANYKKDVKFKLLSPFVFRKFKNLYKMQAIYLPFFRYDLSIDGEISFNGCDVEPIVKDNKNYNEIKKYIVKFNGHFDYEKLIINPNSKFSNEIVDHVLPFDFSEIEVYSDDILDDAMISNFDLSQEDIFGRAKNRAMNSSILLMKDLVNYKKKNVKENNMGITTTNKDIVLLPFYIMPFNYKNRNYYYVVNGQTGKSYCEFPIGVLETVIFGVVLFIVLFLLGMVISLI